MDNLKDIKIDVEFSPDSFYDLQESQRFLNTLISNLPGYVYRVQKIGNDWKMEFVSEGVFEMTGYKPSDFLSERIFFANLVFEDDLEKDTDYVKNALANRKPYQINYRIKTKDGKLKWVWEQGRGIYSKDNKLIATEGFITDISEKKLADEEIIQRNEELAALNAIGQSLSKLAKPEEIIDLIFNMIGKLFDTRNLYIAIYDENKNELSFPVFTINGVSIKNPNRIFGHGLTEYVILTRKSLLINNNLINTFKELGIQQIGEISKSLLSVPIQIGNTVYGVITIQDYQSENKFSEIQSELLMTIASQIAIAFENARLFSALKQELDEKNIAEKKLKTSLSEKDLLLKEVHHRVKNNLQIMSSLLRLQSFNLKNDDVKKVFLESENRIKAMAIVHNKLYSNNSYERIDFADYIKTLITNLFISLNIRSNLISYEMQIKDSLLNIDTAIPLGLIINELISNSLKYAFPNNQKGLIKITLEKNHEYCLSIEDNGVGAKENFDIENSNTLGMTLVNLLTTQIDGRIETDFSNGTKHKIYFRELEYKKRT